MEVPEEILGSVLLFVGSRADTAELILDYRTQDGVEMRLTLGFSERGMWIESKHPRTWISLPRTDMTFPPHSNSDIFSQNRSVLLERYIAANPQVLPLHELSSSEQNTIRSLESILRTCSASFFKTPVPT